MPWPPNTYEGRINKENPADRQAPELHPAVSAVPNSGALECCFFNRVEKLPRSSANQRLERSCPIILMPYGPTFRKFPELFAPSSITPSGFHGGMISWCISPENGFEIELIGYVKIGWNRFRITVDHNGFVPIRQLPVPHAHSNNRIHSLSTIGAWAQHNVNFFFFFGNHAIIFGIRLSFQKPPFRFQTG